MVRLVRWQVGTGRDTAGWIYDVCVVEWHD